MPDWTNLIEALSGGAMGITKGLTAGAEPFKAWEGVRTADLANDRSEITLEDLRQLQDQRNTLPEYYRNAATAEDTLRRLSTSKGNLDIFGNERALDLGKNLADPQGMFQLATQGMDQSSPEYRKILAQFQGYSDPFGAIKSYDSFNIPGMQNRNTNEQAVLAAVTHLAQMQDPTARAYRKEDGTIVVQYFDDQGNPAEMPVPAGTMIQIAAMLQANTPDTAIGTGINRQIAIAKQNADTYKAGQTGSVTTAQGLKALEQQGIQYRQAERLAMTEVINITKSDEFKQTTDPEARAAMIAEPMRRAQAARQRADELDQIYQRVAATSRLPGAGIGGPPSPLPKVPTKGNTQLNVGDVLNRAKGYKAPGQPAGQMRPGEVGGAISGAVQGAIDDPVSAFLAALGGGGFA